MTAIHEHYSADHIHRRTINFASLSLLCTQMDHCTDAVQAIIGTGLYTGIYIIIIKNTLIH